MQANDNTDFVLKLNKDLLEDIRKIHERIDKVSIIALGKYRQSEIEDMIVGYLKNNK